MTRTLRTLVALGDRVDATELTRLLRREDGFEIVAVASGEDERHAALAAAADLVVLGCDGSQDGAVELVADAVARQPGRAVVVVSPHPPNGDLERLFAAGADDVLVLPADRKRLVFSIEKAVARKRGPAAARAGRVVAVIGPKGGTGKTLLASNLGVALARAGRRTTLVDLDLQFGDLGLALGLDPKRTLYDLARAGGGLDAEKLDGFALVHESGARALLAPRRPDEAAAVGRDLLAELWTTLRATSDHVVVDTAAGFPPEVIAAIDAADDLVLVGTLDAGSLKDTMLGLETVTLMGRDPAEVLVVLNRSDSKVGVERRDAVRILGREPDVCVPSDRAVARSVNEGRPIVASGARSRAARAIGELAQLVLCRGAGRSAPAHGGLPGRED